MSIISMVLVVVVAFFAGLEGILDQFQFHQPLVACTLIGLVTGHLEAGIILGGSLQMIALGWSNIGAAIALIYLHLSKTGGNGGGGAATSNDPIGDILEDY
ncbi:TPA: PTS sugar transporter subunit IIC [Streptococcus pneumoniae]